MKLIRCVDLREATRDAVRAMIAYLSKTHGFALEDAYMLCSVAADLRLHEVVRSFCAWSDEGAC